MRSRVRAVIADLPTPPACGSAHMVFQARFPSEVVFAIIDGENPIKVWREYRGLTQQQLAGAARISKPYLSQIETGKRTGSTEILSAIAKALDVSLDQIVRIENT